MEFLVEIEVRLPEGIRASDKAALLDAETERGVQLAEAGTLRAIWRIPGRRANCGIWSACDADALHAAITSLPLWPYLDVEVTPLAEHPVSAACPGTGPG